MSNSNQKKAPIFIDALVSFGLSEYMWAMSLIAYFRHICNSSNVSEKPCLSSEEGGSKWSHRPFPVSGHNLSCREPFLPYSSIKPCLWTKLQEVVEKIGIVGCLIHQKKQQGTGQSTRVLFGLQGVSATFQVVTNHTVKADVSCCSQLLLALFGRWVLKHGSWNI